MARSQGFNWLLGERQAIVQDPGCILHRFSLCSDLNVFGHVDSVSNYVMESRALSFIGC